MQKNTEPCPASSAPIETGARPDATASADTLNPANESRPLTSHSPSAQRPAAKCAQETLENQVGSVLDRLTRGRPRTAEDTLSYRSSSPRFIG